MRPLIPSNYSQILVAPSDWDHRDGECKSLAVIVQDNLVYSFWKPSWKEQLLILFGKPIQLTVMTYQHAMPPVDVGVADYACK